MPERAFIIFLSIMQEIWSKSLWALFAFCFFVCTSQLKATADFTSLSQANFNLESEWKELVAFLCNASEKISSKAENFDIKKATENFFCLCIRKNYKNVVRALMKAQAPVKKAFQYAADLGDVEFLSLLLPCLKSWSYKEQGKMAHSIFCKSIKKNLYEILFFILHDEQISRFCEEKILKKCFLLTSKQLAGKQSLRELLSFKGFPIKQSSFSMEGGIFFPPASKRNREPDPKKSGIALSDSDADLLSLFNSCKVGDKSKCQELLKNKTIKNYISYLNGHDIQIPIVKQEVLAFYLYPLLHLVCFEGHLSLAEVLIDAGFPVNFKRELGKEYEHPFLSTTPLHCAAKGKDGTDIINFLLKKGADPFAVNEEGEIALFDAIRANKVAACFILCKAAQQSTLKAAQKVAQATEQICMCPCAGLLGGYKTPFHHAASVGNVAIMETLASFYDDGLSSIDTNRATPLYCAAEKGNLEMVRYLLNKGAVCDVSSYLLSPLNGAIHRGYLPVVQELLSRNASPFSKDAHGFSALGKALVKKNKIIIPLLLKKIPEEGDEEKELISCFLSSIESEDEEIVLLFMKANVLDKVEDTLSLFLKAAQHNLLCLCKCLLLEKKVPIDTPDKRGWTCLHHAVKRENLGLIQLLLEKGAEISARNRGGGTPLEIAVREKKEQAAYLLLEHQRNNGSLLQPEEGEFLHYLQRIHFYPPMKTLLSSFIF